MLSICSNFPSGLPVWRCPVRQHSPEGWAKYSLFACDAMFLMSFSGGSALVSHKSGQMCRLEVWEMGIVSIVNEVQPSDIWSVGSNWSRYWTRWGRIYEGKYIQVQAYAPTWYSPVVSKSMSRSTWGRMYTYKLLDESMSMGMRKRTSINMLSEQLVTCRPRDRSGTLN